MSDDPKLPLQFINLDFSKRCGKNAEVLEEGTIARRLEKEFNHGVVLTSQDLIAGKGFSVKVTRVTARYRGTLEIGLTSHDPRTMEFPGRMTDLVDEKELNLMFSGKNLKDNNKDIIDLPNQALLTDIKEGDTLCILINTPTNVSLILNDKETRFDVPDLSRWSKVYGVVDIYGHCLEVKLQVCQYYLLCQRYLLSILSPGNDDFTVCFDKRFDKCYCDNCHPIADPVKISPHKYTVDKDWVKFAVKVPPQAYLHKIFDTWHVAYHGTTSSRVQDILKCGELLFPGDETPFGDSVKIAPGHYTAEKRPLKFDVNQIFMTPSIKYCSAGNVYARRNRYHDEVSKAEYDVQVLFKLKVEPSSYKVFEQTLLSSPDKYIDKNFSNKELEWSTKKRKATAIYGLLVRAIEKRN